ncbi:MAG: L-serine ammonia-lyase [Pseudomonadales bacterium]|nr:L-serine ammonia-lyase [Pseudomonadales bacterium]
MAQSVLELFSIGIGPSSSHTVGPMRAARHFVGELWQCIESRAKEQRTQRIQVKLYGSLALTGRGHGTDSAVQLGLAGCEPDSITVAKKHEVLQQISQTLRICCDLQVDQTGTFDIPFDPHTDIIFELDKTLPHHSNGMEFLAFDRQANLLLKRVFYSVGGGFICDEQGLAIASETTDKPILFPFTSCADLLDLCRSQGCTIAELMWRNELCLHSEESLRLKLSSIWQVMNDSIEAGLHTTGILPGGLNVKRRAAHLYERLQTQQAGPDSGMDWLSVYAMAVNEENAAGNRVVTAPTNGAAGVIPAVLKYYFEHLAQFSEARLHQFLLTAAAIGMLYKEGASLSAAEVGCQGEVGVACSMAAAALTAVQGGNIWQIENAAEIGMEHNLGLTCDPVGGLVQIPCIERNTMGAVKAVNASHLALNSDGQHLVSLDKVIATMLRTGRDMQIIYKETSLGGLAVQVNMPEC